MKLKKWQTLELVGTTFILLSFLIQFFIAVSIEGNQKKSEAYLLEDRLHYLYQYIKTGKDSMPNWYQLDQEKSGKGFSFEEVYNFTKPLSIFIFILGSCLLLIGKYIEFGEANNT